VVLLLLLLLERHRRRFKLDNNLWLDLLLLLHNVATHLTAVPSSGRVVVAVL
jgi:hypothetical protein